MILGNLSMGIDNYSGTWYKGFRFPWTTSFNANFSLFLPEKENQFLQNLFAIPTYMVSNQKKNGKNHT